MDLIKILNAQGIEGETAGMIEAAIKGQLHKEFIPKAQYNKKVQELDSIREEADDLKARAETPNEYKGKYEDIMKEFEQYKTDIAQKETRHNISSIISKALKDDGFTNEKVVGLMLKDLDYNNLSLEGDEVKGFDLSAFTKGYEEFKTVRNTEGTPATTPPQGNATKFTLESINGMTASEIARNYDQIRKNLQE